MNDDDSSGKPGGDRRRPPITPADPLDDAAGDRRREPVFTDFDEDEDYEESERDTDYASAYEEGSDDEDELEPLEDDDPDLLSSDWQVLGAGPAGAGRSRDTDRNPWAVEDSIDPGEEDRDADAAGLELFDNEYEDDEEEPDNDDPDDDWDDEEPDSDEFEDDPETETADYAQRWPLGLVIVGLVALVLLAAGGYGVIQQRSAAQQEIRQLQATLATAANPAEVASSREALREMEQRAADNQATIDALTLENRRLNDTVAGLEEQLAAQKSAPKPAAAARPATTPAATKAAPKQAATAAGASAATGGDWFVNFSSYSQRSVADNWLKKLKPSAGKAVVIPGARDGRTFYRVRVVGLTDRAQAQKVASQLQAAHNLPPLWVGRE
jgi:cell division septation protein DedD